jgi:cardiolipin synthase
MSAPRSTPHPATQALASVGAATLLVLGARFLTHFLGSSRAFGMHHSPDVPLDSPAFLQFLSVVTNGAVRRARTTRLRNGVEFYPAQLTAIRAARRSINMEFYEFLDGSVVQEFLTALTARARAGVEVRVLVDALGSFGQRSSLFAPLKAAGGHMHWYHPIRPRTWPDFNNRSHRKVLVVDASVGFIGGAGIADHWLYASPAGPTWRDSVFQVEGPAVLGLVSTFAENWLEASGSILCGPAQFVPHASESSGDERDDDLQSPSFVVLSTPKGGATQNHILFQALIQSAQRSICITTPYFLPDRSARAALIAAVRRGVDVRILVAGPHIDHKFIRHLSHNSSRRLLRAGARIFEYQPSMIHAKTMTVDGQWAVVGSTNFDHRSFALNDEVNLATLNPGLVVTLESDFEEDIRASKPLTLASLPPPGLLTGVEGALGALAEAES